MTYGRVCLLLNREDKPRLDVLLVSMTRTVNFKYISNKTNIFAIHWSDNLSKQCHSIY